MACPAIATDTEPPTTHHPPNLPKPKSFQATFAHFKAFCLYCVSLIVMKLGKRWKKFEEKWKK